MSIVLNGTTGITTPDLTSAAGFDTSDINDGAITAAKIATAAVGRDKLEFNTPLEIVSSVNLNGLSSYAFSITSYPAYMLFFDCVTSTISGANLQIRASYDGGSSYPSNWNYREVIYGVNNTSASNYANTGNAAVAWLRTNMWNGNGTPGTAGTGGYVKIQGCGGYWGTDKRLTFEGTFGGQSPSGQELSHCMGQTQDDGSQYNTVSIETSSGTFKLQSRLLICGIRSI